MTNRELSEPGGISLAEWDISSRWDVLSSPNILGMSAMVELARSIELDLEAGRYIKGVSTTL